MTVFEQGSPIPADTQAALRVLADAADHAAALLERDGHPEEIVRGIRAMAQHTRAGLLAADLSRVAGHG